MGALGRMWAAGGLGGLYQGLPAEMIRSLLFQARPPSPIPSPRHCWCCDVTRFASVESSLTCADELLLDHDNSLVLFVGGLLGGVMSAEG